MTNLRAYLAELLGTFFLTFAGVSAIISTQNPINSGAGLLEIALAHGLALSVAVSAFGGISGAHINPAVTIGFLSTGRIKPADAAGYIIGQLLGATIAAVICNIVFPAEAVDAVNLGIPLPGAWVGTGTVLLVEIVLTFLLMTAIFGTAVDTRGAVVNIGGFAIGLTVTFDILAGGPVTGASMNPARSFGPALVHGHFEWHWCYWVAPIIGALLAAQLYHHVLLPEEPVSTSESAVTKE